MSRTAPASIATDTPPPQRLVARFAEALDRLRPGEDHIGLAVSGGPDSMAMLLLAHAAIPGRFEVASIDHGLRPEAPDECALVERACAERAVPCRVLSVEVASGNLQANARAARYEALAGWAEERGLAAIATAHHADDQAETLLMRLNRGSGVSGLAGVRERGRIEGLALDIIRPLLTFRRGELAQIVQAAGLAVAHDPSNRDESYDRVRIRNALASSNWIDPAALARSAAYLAEAEEALAQFLEEVWLRSVSQGEHRLSFSVESGRFVKLRITERAIALLGSPPRGSDVARLVDRLEHGEGGNIGGVLVTARDGIWLFEPEPPRR